MSSRESRISTPALKPLLLTITASLAANCLFGSRLRETRLRAPVGRRNNKGFEWSGDQKMPLWSLTGKKKKKS